MTDNFTKNFVITVALTVALLALDQAPNLMAHTENRRRVAKIVSEMKNSELDREGVDALAAGYYEGLRKNGHPYGWPVEKDDVRMRSDFLQYEFKPNVQRGYAAGMRITNSLGMPNPEYGYEKPPHTWRIALFGDSVSVGPYGHDYVALLENRLNQSAVTSEIQRIQILNFSVYGYGVLQMMDVALEKAPKFHPDVYLIALTILEANRKSGGWSSHIASLWLDGADLKYGFLRDIAVRAGLDPTDHLPVLTRKLEPFQLEVTRWALQQIRDHAAFQGAQTVIVLVPTPVSPEIIAEEFNEIRPAIDSIGLPVVDLRDAFLPNSRNLSSLQVDPGLDNHPNGRAHQILFEELYKRISQNPRVSDAVLGYASQHASLSP